MDWIHCNKCFVQLEQGIILHLTSCGHMFCNSCLDNGAKQTTCFVCRVPCSTMKLVPDMNPDVQDYFTDPEELIKKSCEVLQFQRQHRKRLLSYLLQSTKKFYTARTELKRMSDLCQKQHKQLKEYQRVIKKLETQLSEQTKQTSPFSIPISPGSNPSPGFLQSTPTYKRTAKSTPYSSDCGATIALPDILPSSSSVLFSAELLSESVEASSRSDFTDDLKQTYQSNLVTPARISKHRTSCASAQSQRSNTSNKISSTVFTPPTPESAGGISNESGYYSNESPANLIPRNCCVLQGLHGRKFRK